jgi:hypothetical protein
MVEGFAGKRLWPRRAVDEAADALDALVQRRGERAAAKKPVRRLPRRQVWHPGRSRPELPSSGAT